MKTVKIIPAKNTMNEIQYLKLNFLCDLLYLINVVTIKLNKKLKIIPFSITGSVVILSKPIIVAKINNAPANIPTNNRHKNIAFLKP
jgi:hypothetical protein